MDARGLYVEVGALVRNYRKTAGTKQSDLATKCGLNRATIAAIESGRQAVALHQIFQIAAALNIRPAALIPQNTQFEIAQLLSHIDASTSDDLAVFSKMAAEVVSGQSQSTVKVVQDIVNGSAL